MGAKTEDGRAEGDVTKALRDNRDEVRDFLAEVLEDVALANAIERGQKTRPVKRDAVMRALAGRR